MMNIYIKVSLAVGAKKEYKNKRLIMDNMPPFSK